MKIKYVLKKLKTVRYKELFNKAEEIGEKINKNKYSVLFDMTKCALKYGSGYMDYFEFEFYLLNDEERSTYLTGRINNEIIKKYNNKEYFNKFSNKVEFNKIFNKYLGRSYIDLSTCSFKEFKEFILDKDKIIVKPINECGGKGIEVIEIDKNKLKNEYNVLKIYNKIVKNNQILVEEYINQNSKLSNIYSKSVNSLRILTFIDDTGTVRIMNSILKIGNNGNVDNFSSGGMYTFVNNEGIVYVPAIDEKGNIYSKHPVTKENILGFHIPNYELVLPFVTELALVVPEVRYVGWDIVITEDGILVIEGNEYPGIFQVKPSISGIKKGDLPKYKQYMNIR